MPELDGYDSAREIRKQESSTARATPVHIPVTALTANAMEGDHPLCISAGMDDHLSKPFTRGQLSTAMDRWLPTA